jgi:hypothetical protein
MLAVMLREGLDKDRKSALRRRKKEKKDQEKAKKKGASAAVCSAWMHIIYCTRTKYLQIQERTHT